MLLIIRVSLLACERKRGNRKRKGEQRSTFHESFPSERAFTLLPDKAQDRQIPYHFSAKKTASGTPQLSQCLLVLDKGAVAAGFNCRDDANPSR